MREVQSEIILAVAWLARVNHKTLGALLRPVVELGWPIVATLSDKQGGVRKALAEVLSDVPHQWCQSHYLGNSNSKFGEGVEVACKMLGLGLRFARNPNKPEVE